jgi:hypothetical protein
VRELMLRVGYTKTTDVEGRAMAEDLMEDPDLTARAEKAS